MDIFFQLRCLPQQSIARIDPRNWCQQLSNQALRDECKFYNCIDSVLDQTFAGIEVYQGKPEVKVLKDVWYFPEHLALFSVDGTRIDESCFRHSAHA